MLQLEGMLMEKEIQKAHTFLSEGLARGMDQSLRREPQVAARAPVAPALAARVPFCTVCLSDVSLNMHLQIMQPCAHCVCFECFTQLRGYANVPSRCPLCRREVLSSVRIRF